MSDGAGDGSELLLEVLSQEVTSAGLCSSASWPPARVLWLLQSWDPRPVLSLSPCLAFSLRLCRHRVPPAVQSLGPYAS